MCDQKQTIAVARVAKAGIAGVGNGGVEHAADGLKDAFKATS
jgi:hypothetical protein